MHSSQSSHPLRRVRRAAPRRERRTALAAGLTALVVATVVGCNNKDLTGTDSRSSAEAARADITAADGSGAAALAMAGSGVAPAGTIPLPVNQSIATTSPAPAFGVTQTGTGPNGVFKINKTTSTQAALLGQTNGGAGSAAVSGKNLGAGFAGFFEISNPSNSSPALFAESRGTGNAAQFFIANASSAADALLVGTTGAGRAILATANTGGEALSVINGGTGFAARFEGRGSGKGVIITTEGGAGLQVFGGSKNAVVPTPGGTKALYTEESTEVWFTDYGFGKLERGRARVLLDPSFAQTINPEEPYHVFLQARGNAELYVGESTPLGFEVALREGDPNAEFSYRVVAKRLGFEDKRLEPAP
jgi:hypothetical protein